MHAGSLTYSLTYSLQQVHACSVCTRARLQHTYYSSHIYCTLLKTAAFITYLSVEICVATIRNFQPLDAEKLLVNVGMAPRKWRDSYVIKYCDHFFYIMFIFFI